MPALRLSGIAVICCLLTIFTLAIKPVTDPDFWWHLATGRYMVSTHTIPHHDVFSLTARSHSWITHEWITELLFYAGWSVGGVRLLMLATAGVITLTFGLVFVAARERGAPPLLSGAVVLLSALASAHTWGTRPQMLSLLLTALFGLAVTRMIVRNMPAPPMWLPVVMAVWVNIHGGFIFGLALLTMAVATYVARDWYRSTVSTFGHAGRAAGADEQRRVDGRRCAAVVGLTALATLANPNGLSGALYPFSYLGNNASTRYIAEWVSPDFHKPEYLLFEALVLLLLVAALAGARRARLVDVVVLVPFLYLSFESVRNIPLFAVLGAPIIAELLAFLLPSRPRRTGAGLAQPRAKSAMNWVAAVVIVAGVAASWGDKLSDGSQARAVAAMYPTGALRFMAAHDVPARGFDSYNWGGFLIWHWYPNRLVFVDGRPDMYGDAFMDRYMRAYSGDKTWQTLFAANKLCFALVEPSTGIAGALRADSSWVTAYQDKVSVLFERVDRHNQCD